MSSQGLPKLGGAQVKLTSKAIAALAVPAGKAEVIFFDDGLPGFGLRLRSTGAARWIYQYKTGVRHRRVTLGAMTAVSLAHAREIASELHAKVRLGYDPAGAKAEGRTRAAETVAAVLESYLQHQRGSLRPRSYVEVERHLLKHCKPLHDQQLAQVDRRAIAAQLGTIATRSGSVTCNRVRASLSAFFAWSVREGLIEVNPVLGTNKRPECSRDRVLAESELAAIWTATDTDSDYHAVVRLLTLTMCRLSEIAGLRWSEVLGEEIVLPADRTKSGREHVIPLSVPARAILDVRPRVPGRDLVFVGRSGGPLSGWTAHKAALDERIRANGAAVDTWNHHDLRRTAATILERAGIAPHVVSALLNHSNHRSGLHNVYVVGDVYGCEKRFALELWARRVTDGAEAVALMR